MLLIPVATVVSKICEQSVPMSKPFTLTCVLVLCELVSLVVFPVMFFFEMGNYGVRSWEFDWSYGVAWGAMLFAFGASLMLICDKEHEEVYYKEKTIYNPPADLA